MIPAYRYALLAIALVLSAGVASAQVATGTPPFGSFGGGPDVINLANLNSHITIPVLHKAGRGLNFTYDLSYESSVWYPVGASGSQTWQPVQNWGWRGQTEAATGYTSASSTSVTCVICNPYTCWTATGEIIVSNWVYHDPFGISHPFSGSAYLYTGACPNLPGPSTGFTSTATDGSGYTLTVAVSGSSITAATVTARDGTIQNGPYGSTGGAGSGTDRNGNQITVDGSGHFYDTLSSTTPVLTVAGSGSPTSPMTFTYAAPSGAPSPYTINYTNYTVATNFAVSGINEYRSTAAVPLVSSVVLPDGSQYSFLYEATPSIPTLGACTPYAGTTCVTARVTSITLPTGGSITYAYSEGAGTNNSGIHTDGSAATLTRTITPGGVWIYAQVKGTGAATTTTVTAPQLTYDSAANQTVIQFQGIYETQRQVYQGSTSGTLLRTRNTCYNGSALPCTSISVSLPITQQTVTDQYGSSGLQCKHNYFYNSVGGLSEQDDYDYGSGAPGALLRKILITYASLGNITAFQQRITVCNGSGTSSSCTGPSGSSTGTVVAQTNYNYDESAAATSTGVAQHISVSGSRGNLTSINYPVSGLTAHYTYWDTGSPNTSQDVNGATTTFNYSSNTASCQMRFPTSVIVTQPISMSRSFAWNCTGGVETSVTDENSQQRTTTYNDQFFWRPATQSFPDGGQTSWTYNSVTGLTTSRKMNSTQNIVNTLLLDGLGRRSQTQLNSDPQGVDYTVITYDALGRAYQVYNPTRCSPPTTNCGSESTWGYATSIYDALGRVTKLTLPDGSVATALYTDNTVTVTDPAGKKRQSTVDSLGRLTQVTEDPGGLGYVTTYSYDGLSNLTSVTQNGGRQRTYTYDALSRLVCESNPEIQIATCPNPDNGSYTAGTIRYTYDTNGNLTSRQAPAPNQTGSSTVTTSYQYDALHRLTQISYSDGNTPSANFVYDTQSGWQNPAITQTNIVGRLSITRLGTDPQAEQIFSYDAVGRVTKNNQCTPVNCNLGSYSLNYSYDLAGNMQTYTDGVGETYAQSFDTAGRVTQLNSSWVDSQHPATMLSGISYNPANATTKLGYGNGLTQTAAFNKNLQPCRINLNSTATALATCSDAIPTGNLQDSNYGFNLGTSDNGNVMSWTSTGQQTFNRTFTYDSLNRLATMQETSGSAAGCKPSSSPTNPYTISWNYDAWGNRTSQSPNSGTCSFNQSVNTQNHLVGPPYQFDATGNLTYDGSHTYFYDAENRLTQVDGTFGNCSTATACYLYDAAGRRARKSVGAAQTNYMYGLDGKVISEVDQNNIWMNVYLHMNGRFIAQYLIGLPRTQFILSDHLGSARVLTKYDGTLLDSLDFLPFGEQIAGGSGTTHKFTDDEHDAETGLDHTQDRQYSSSLGRWMTSDPAGLAAADASNPQSWNRYAYVLDDPIDNIDPTGDDAISGICLSYQASGASPALPCYVGGGNGGYGPYGWGSGGLWDVFGPGIGGIGGGIWDEQWPIYTGPPLDPNLIIYNWHYNDNGSPVGDRWGEELCLTHPLDPSCDWVYWNPDTQAWENDVPLPPGVGAMLGAAGKMGDAGVKAAMVATAPEYILMGGIALWDALPAWFTDAFNGINDNPLFRVGRGWNKAGKEIWRWASGGRWGKGGPKLPWHWHIP